MTGQEFADEILKPALDLFAEEYGEDSLEYEEVPSPGNPYISVLKVEVNGQEFIISSGQTFDDI